jgi:hypothetical protein
MSEKPSSSAMEYFRALRTEIIEAQKLRVQVGLAKVVFLGSLLGFFLKEGRGGPGILICPFVALMFDCMIYGLSFNIRDVGNYIARELEKQMLLDPENGDFTPWQRYRKSRAVSPFRDWGRIIYRMGNYGLSIAATALSFSQVWYPTHLISVWWQLSLSLILALGWGALVWLEFVRHW